MNKVTTALLVIGAVCSYFYFSYLQKKEVQDCIRPLATQVAYSHRPRMVFFHADWCGSCCKVQPAVYAVAEQYGKQIDFQNCDITTPEGDKQAREIGVMGIPTLLIFDSKGHLVKECGNVSQGELEKGVQEAIR